MKKRAKLWTKDLHLQRNKMKNQIRATSTSAGPEEILSTELDSANSNSNEHFYIGHTCQISTAINLNMFPLVR